MIKRNVEVKKTEQALKETVEKFRTLSEGSPNMIFISYKGKVVYANQKCETTLGYTKDEFYSDDFSFLSLISPEYVETLKLALAKHTKDEEIPPYEHVLISRDGKKISVIINSKIIEYNGDKAILGTVTDITELKKNEKALIDSRNEYESLFLNSVDGIIVAKRDGRIISVNPAICRMLGMNEQELLKSCRKDIFVEDQRNHLALKEQDENGKVEAQLSLRRKNSTLLKVEIASRNFLDTDGSTSTLISVRDIRDRLMLEEKLRTIGSFTRHDIRNKLSTAFGQAYLSKKLVNNQPELTKRLDQIESSLNSIKGILDFAKKYESIDYQKLRQIDVGKTVDEAYSLFGDIKGICLVNKVCESTVIADHMLTTLFYNLIDNTVKHGEKADCIEVYIQKNKDGSENIVYTDNGIGISPRDKLKLFEPAIGDGKGNGLFLIKKTCEFYGWTITEDGEPGKGARFNITISKSNFVNKETATFNEYSILKVSSKGGQNYC